MKQVFRKTGATFVLVAIFAGLLTFMANIGQVEGARFPVSTEYVITKRELTGFDTVIDMTFAKVRNCQFIGQRAFYLVGEYWHDARIIYQVDGPPATRPLGRYAVKWRFGISEPFEHAKIRLVLEHRCWGLIFWNTITTVEPADAEP